MHKLQLFIFYHHNVASKETTAPILFTESNYFTLYA